MSKYLFPAALAAGLAALVPATALAADGTITITGAVNGSTCEINGSSGQAAVNVTLPTVSTTTLNAAGSVAGRTRFSLALSGCGALTQATTFFEPGPTIDTTTGNLTNATTSGAATGVEVQLLNSDFSAIALGNASGAQNSQPVALASGAGTLNYYAQYYATAAAAAGSVSTSVQFTMLYQ